MKIIGEGIFKKMANTYKEVHIQKQKIPNGHSYLVVLQKQNIRKEYQHKHILHIGNHGDKSGRSAFFWSRGYTCFLDFC